MRKLRAALAVVFSLFPLIHAAAQNKELVIYSFVDMFPPEIIRGFEQSSGFKVRFETFELNEDMLEALEVSEGKGYDLVISDDYIIEFVINEGLAQKLNKGKLSNLGNVDPTYQFQFHDPQNLYTVPYGAGVMNIVYDPAKVKLDITGYKDLWSSSLRKSVGVIGNYRVINGMALKERGKSYNTEEVADIQAAGGRLKALAPNIRVIRDTGLEEDLVAGRISVAVMYTDQVTKSKQENPNLKVVFPSEGIGFGTMAAFIPRGSANVDGAHRFLNYILDPRRGAQCFEYLGYYCTYKASEQYIKPELKDFLIMPKFIRNFEMIQNLSQEAENEHYKIWREFNAAVKP
ncbi:MAG: spermidine/putrescine ABC transporter substrate-binding protein [Treponema sp.]|jgi:spermidine/putrescine-binding protein|nr:spermidine/putrescine ABC transporter substrate-binding protein [Treponema sp.]